MKALTENRMFKEWLFEYAKGAQSNGYWPIASKSTIISCHAGLQLRVCNENLIFLFLNQNICCGYSKEPSQ